MLFGSSIVAINFNRELIEISNRLAFSFFKVDLCEKFTVDYNYIFIYY